jgi:CMP-N,N'-diacetyllegionaminic acid synthase
MSNKRQVLAIIPARGGSKGLPRKNIRDLCGKPLIAYSIEAALHAKTIARVIVSTEDEETAATAVQYGAEVPALRPLAISGDNALVGTAIQHMVGVFQERGYQPDAVVTLFPTQPFRTPKLVDHLIDTLFQGYTSVYTGKPIAVHRTAFFASDFDGELTPIDKKSIFKTDKLNSYYRKTGLFMGSRTGVDVHQRPYLYLLTNPISWIDIDYLEDFLFAESIIQQGRFDFFGPCLP